MIDKWSVQKINKNLEYVRNGHDLYLDKRGKISNHELTEPINLIGLIDSKKGTNSRKSLSSTTRAKVFIHKRTNY